MPQHIIIVGADETARLLAERLIENGESISMIDTDADNCAKAQEMRGVSVYCADATEKEVLKKAGVPEAKCAIVATPSDKVNILVCQAIRADQASLRLVARVNTSTNLAAFEQAGIEVMSPSRATATVLENLVLRPSLFNFLASGMGEERIREVRISGAKSGRTLASLRLRNCVVVAIRRGDGLIPPRGLTEVQRGDVLTILGEEADLEEAMDKLLR